MQELKKKIKDKVMDKKELKNISPKFLESELDNFIDKNKKLWKELKEKYPDNKDKIHRSREFKKTIKSVRSKLREVFGVFYLRGFENAEDLINSITPKNKIAISFKLLKLHRSSKERLRYYEEIYDKVYELVGMQPETILDLACGYNPFSYFFLRESFQCSPDYVCCDIGKKDIYLINKFFQNTEINGKAFYCDLRKDLEKVKKFNVDLCFMFKTLDSIEENNGISEKILKEINTKYFVVSFPTKTISGTKTINKKKRIWFYRLIKKLGYTYNEFSIHNEIFIVVKK